MSEAPKVSSPRVPRQKKPRRTNAGRRSLPDADMPKPLSEEDLDQLEVAAVSVPGGVVIRRPPAELHRLIAEARRLRQLVMDVAPHVPDNPQTRMMDLPARLKAETDRG